MSSLFEQTYNPDVLSCLANLSNDEVFTPPEVANQMLDLLPAEIWADPDIKILDPACKSGVFLREAAKRMIDAQLPGYARRVEAINEKKRNGEPLTEGDEGYLAYLQEVVDHIFKEQLYGIAITELTSLLSRRSVYCSKYPNSKYSVAQFDKDDVEGNIRFKNCQHSWYAGRCKYCGASKKQYDEAIRDGLETHAYEFIHVDKPEELLKLKFDVIIGNPPYQLSDGGGNGSSAVPIYQHFIAQAKKLNPRYMSMIVPAKWHSGGKGLDAFRAEMLADKRIRRMVTYGDSRECFNGVDVAGGVCYFLWDRDHKGSCIATMYENGDTMTSERVLDEYPIYIASDKALGIVRTVAETGHPSFDAVVRARNPFGIGAGVESSVGELNLRYKAGLTKIARSKVTTGEDLIDKWKVIVSKAAAEHAGQSDKNGQRKMLTVIETLPPGTVCSETYLVVDAFESEQRAKNLEKYLKTKFVRYLIWLATPTQNISRSCFAFVPVIDLSAEPTDGSLYRQFNLSQEQKDEIEAKIKEHGKGDDRNG